MSNEESKCRIKPECEELRSKWASGVVVMVDVAKGERVKKVKRALATREKREVTTHHPPPPRLPASGSCVWHTRTERNHTTMPYNFRLPTTSQVDLTQHLTSTSHPSLPLAATTSRGILRNALKRHKRLAPAQQPAHLVTVLAALNEYIPYACTLDAGVSARTVADEEVHVVLAKELVSEWRATLAAAPPGRSEQPRIQLKSYEYELLFVYSTLAATYYLLARAQLGTIQDPSKPPLNSEQRTVAIATAMKHLLTAHGIYTYLSSCEAPPTQASALDISPAVLSSLAALCLAEATLIAVLKDDPYPAAVAQARNKNDKEWMYKAPTISKVRAHLFARLCMAAAEHASKAQSGLTLASRALEPSLLKYTDDLRRSSRAKACRFLGLDAEITGRTGEGIAWLRAAQKELGLARAEASDDDPKKKTPAALLSRFKNIKEERAERKEDKLLARGGDWGSDAGRTEEARILDSLLEKWTKMNNTVNVQIVPPSEPLLASLPSGREYHTGLQAWTPPCLGVYELSQMRGLPEANGADVLAAEDKSSDEEGDMG